MTNEQESHLSYLKKDFERRVDKKYRAGAVEHSGDVRDLTVLQLLEESIGEAVDQYTYLSTLRDKELDRLATLSNGDSAH